MNAHVPNAHVRYDSHSQFYQEVYPQSVVAHQVVGALGASLLDIEQGAGDWSDAPSPDLVISRLVSRPVGATIGLGAGRFRERMRRDEFVLTPPGIQTLILVDAPHRIQVLALPYARLRDALGAESRLPPDGDFGALHARQNADPLITSLMTRLAQEAASGQPGGSLLADSAIVVIADALARASRSARAAASARGGLAPWQVRRATDHMRAHLERDVSLAELAALAELSPHHFCRAFKRSTGLPPHAWLLQRRIERAKELLADPRLGLTEVALCVGYASQSAFGTAFRRVTGVTPSQWRRERLS